MSNDCGSVDIGAATKLKNLGLISRNHMVEGGRERPLSSCPLTGRQTHIHTFFKWKKEKEKPYCAG